MSRRISRDSGADVSQISTLGARLRERIRREGPITFHEWMRAALYDERDGYYRRRGVERWGREGDYRTSPERSALFGATFARHFATLFDELGRPSAFHLLEAGGGAGQFARGVLHTLERDAPDVFQSLQYIFDESSEDSRTRAVELLTPFAGRVVFRCIEDFTVPLDTVVVFSNELLDAFPVHRVVMRDRELRELFVGIATDDTFTYIEREPSTPRLAEHFARLCVTLAEGQFAEVNLGAEESIKCAARIVGHGFVVSVDYGDEAERLFGEPYRREGTLRAFRGHELMADVLREPGAQDLTTTVDWTHARLVGEAAGLETIALERLDSFLLRAGLLEQLERETALAVDEAEIARLRLDAREMILPGGMASSFQVLVQKKS